MLCRFKSFVLGSTTYKSCFLFVFLLGGLVLRAQSNEVSYVPADSEFVLKITRIKTEVVFSITFNDSLVFDNVSIEREPDFGQAFTQCTYITYAEAKNKTHHVIKKDIYPYPASTDVSYRIKLTSKDGSLRTYPPILLPAVSK